MRRLVPLAALAGLAVLAAPASADVRFEGESSQGRRVVVVAEDNGVPKRVRIGWRGSCGRPGFRLLETTTFSSPLEVATRRRLRDGGTYRLRDQGGERIALTVRISGRKVGPRRWAGRFRGQVVVRRRGRVLDRCSARGVRWAVVRPGRR